jgi:hypothetical protein
LTLLDCADLTNVSDGHAEGGKEARRVQVLGCGHMFCKNCIQRYLDNLLGGDAPAKANEVKYPVCKSTACCYPDVLFSETTSQAVGKMLPVPETAS